MTFLQLPPDETLRLAVYDGEPHGVPCLSNRQLHPKKLLGEADLRLAHVQVRVWEFRVFK